MEGLVNGVRPLVSQSPPARPRRRPTARSTFYIGPVPCCWILLQRWSFHNEEGFYSFAAFSAKFMLNNLLAILGLPTSSASPNGEPRGPIHCVDRGIAPVNTRLGMGMSRVARLKISKEAGNQAPFAL